MACLFIRNVTRVKTAKATAERDGPCLAQRPIYRPGELSQALRVSARRYRENNFKIGEGNHE